MNFVNILEENADQFIRQALAKAISAWYYLLEREKAKVQLELLFNYVIASLKQLNYADIIACIHHIIYHEFPSEEINLLHVQLDCSKQMQVEPVLIQEMREDVLVVLSIRWNTFISEVFQLVDGASKSQCDIILVILNLWRCINNDAMKENRKDLFGSFLNSTYIKYLFHAVSKMTELSFKLYLDILMQILSIETNLEHCTALPFSTTVLNTLPMGDVKSEFCGSTSKEDDDTLIYKCNPVVLSKVTYIFLKLLCCMQDEDEICVAFYDLECFVKRMSNIVCCSAAHSWIIPLFLDHDDLLIGAMMSVLQLYLLLQSQSKKVEHLKKHINPHKMFLKLVSVLGNDHHVFMDFLMNESTMLPYLLQYLKVVVNDWPFFFASHTEYDADEISRKLKLSGEIKTSTAIVSYSSSSSSEDEMDITAPNPTIILFQNLRIGIEKLSKQNEFPYNAKPLILLLQACDDFKFGVK